MRNSKNCFIFTKLEFDRIIELNSFFIRTIENYYLLLFGEAINIKNIFKVKIDPFCKSYKIRKYDPKKIFLSEIETEHFKLKSFYDLDKNCISYLEMCQPGPFRFKDLYSNSDFYI